MRYSFVLAVKSEETQKQHKRRDRRGNDKPLRLALGQSRRGKDIKSFLLPAPSYLVAFFVFCARPVESKKGVNATRQPTPHAERGGGVQSSSLFSTKTNEACSFVSLSSLLIPVDSLLLSIRLRERRRDKQKSQRGRNTTFASQKISKEVSCQTYNRHERHAWYSCREPI